MKAKQILRRVGLARLFWQFRSAPPLAERSSGRASISAGPRKQILIVDDDPVILKTTSTRLEGAGYDVVTAEDGSEAISVVGQAKPDLILLDMYFPPDVPHGGIMAWDGLRLMSWLRSLENTATTRFIIISGGDSALLSERSLRSGAAAFFPKPIDHGRLLEVIGKELGETSPTDKSSGWWSSLFGFL
jgi:CheY-like chemotaxis protein